MSPEQAKLILDTYCKDIEAESPITRKVIAAIPEEKSDYTPHPASMTALDLAWHIASSEIFFLDGVLNASFAHGDGGRPDSIRTPADVNAWRDSALPAKLAEVAAIAGEKAAAPVDFFGVLNWPAVLYLGLLVKHSAHHRGQLSAYLRPMGAKVPGIYGGSADEPMG